MDKLLKINLKKSLNTNDKNDCNKFIYCVYSFII